MAPQWNSLRIPRGKQRAESIEHGTKGRGHGAERREHGARGIGFKAESANLLKAIADSL